MLDSRVGRSAKDLRSNQCLFTHYGGSNRYKIAINLFLNQSILTPAYHRLSCLDFCRKTDTPLTSFITLPAFL